MTIKERLNRLKGKESPAENIVKLMEYFHWSIEDVQKLKVPQYFSLIELLNSIAKKKPKPKKGKGR